MVRLCLFLWVLNDTYFKQFSQIEKTLEQEGRQWHEITTIEEVTIRNIAASTTKTAYNAQAVLYLAYGEEYPVELADSPSILAQNSNLWVNFKTQNFTNPQIISRFYPNPAKNLVYMDYHLIDDTMATLNIYNMSGQLVYRHSITGKGTLSINSNELINGLYFYEVIYRNGTLIRDKLVITK